MRISDDFFEILIFSIESSWYSMTSARLNKILNPRASKMVLCTLLCLPLLPILWENDDTLFGGDIWTTTSISPMSIPSSNVFVDIINAFCEEPIDIPRGKVMFAVFPGAFVIIASILVAYTFLSIKSKKKES